MQRNGDFLAVRQLDADRVLAGNRRENVDPLGTSGAGDVALQAQIGTPQAGGRIDFVARDRRPFRDVTRRDRNSELGQRFDQDLLNFLQLRRIGRDAAFDVVLI